MPHIHVKRKIAVGQSFLLISTKARLCGDQITALGSLPGVDIHTVAEYARHADIRTSEIYMRGSSSVKVKTSIANLAATMPKAAKKAPGRVVAFTR